MWWFNFIKFLSYILANKIKSFSSPHSSFPASGSSLLPSVIDYLSWTSFGSSGTFVKQNAAREIASCYETIDSNFRPAESCSSFNVQVKLILKPHFTVSLSYSVGKEVRVDMTGWDGGGILVSRVVSISLCFVWPCRPALSVNGNGWVAASLASDGDPGADLHTNCARNPRQDNCSVLMMFITCRARAYLEHLALLLADEECHTCRFLIILKY